MSKGKYILHDTQHDLQEGGTVLQETLLNLQETQKGDLENRVVLKCQKVPMPNITKMGFEETKIKSMYL